MVDMEDLGLTAGSSLATRCSGSPHRDTSISSNSSCAPSMSWTLRSSSPCLVSLGAFESNRFLPSKMSIVTESLALGAAYD